VNYRLAFLTLVRLYLTTMLQSRAANFNSRFSAKRWSFYAKFWPKNGSKLVSVEKATNSKHLFALSDFSTNYPVLKLHYYVVCNIT